MGCKKTPPWWPLIMPYACTHLSATAPPRSPSRWLSEGISSGFLNLRAVVCVPSFGLMICLRVCMGSKRVWYCKRWKSHALVICFGLLSHYKAWIRYYNLILNYIIIYYYHIVSYILSYIIIYYHILLYIIIYYQHHLSILKLTQ